MDYVWSYLNGFFVVEEIYALPYNLGTHADFSMPLINKESIQESKQ